MKNALKKFGALAIVLAAVVAILPASGASAAKMRGMLYLDGDIVRTFVVPAPLPHGGIDPLYMVTNGVSEQLGITAVGPGYPNYHGGAWAVHTVTFNAGVTVKRVVDFVYRQGLTAGQIVEQMPHLTLAGVYAALAYYHANKEHLDAEFSAEDSEATRTEEEWLQEHDRTQPGK
jgi:uncharacterized protein (DUF433 family)